MYSKNKTDNASDFGSADCESDQPKYSRFYGFGAGSAGGRDREGAGYSSGHGFSDSSGYSGSFLIAGLENGCGGDGLLIPRNSSR